MIGPPRAALVTNVLAHYRVPCFRALSEKLDGRLVVFSLTEDMEHRRYVLPRRPAEDGPGFETHTLPGRRWQRPPWDDLHWSDPRPVVDGGFDVVVLGGWAEPAYLRLWLSHLRRRARLLFWVESTAFDRPRSWIKEGLKRLLLRGAAGCVVPGRRSRDYCRRLGMAGERIFTAPNAADRDYFAGRAGRLLPRREPLRAELELDPPAFLFAGRLVESIKGVAPLIRAMAELEARGVPATLVIAGDGPDRGRTEDLALRLGCRDVRFLGFVDHETLCRWYAAVDALVLPSRSETWGFVLNEAMEFGLPLVVSEAVGAGPDLVRPEENGFVVPVGDARALARVLERLAREDGLRRRMGEASRRIVEDFSPEAWARGMARAIRSSRGRGRGPAAGKN